MFISSILKNAVRILATNPEIRKKAGELAFKAYKVAKPAVKDVTNSIKKSIKNNYKK
jgi:hypothetical protein